MRAKRLVGSMLLLMTICLLPLASQGQKSKPAAGVPSQVRFAGVLSDGSGAPRAGTVGILFAIYGEHRGGAPLWQETQNVQLDAQGRYVVLLGAGRDLPKDIFTSNEARWLGVQVLADAEPEQARVLLVSVPYALKAQDAETLGGRPASAYVLNNALTEALSGVSAGSKGKITGGQAAGVTLEGTVNTTGAHTVNAIPKFSAVDTLANSLMFEQYNQVALDAYGTSIVGNEDVVRLGDGTGLRKRLQIAGRLVSEGFDINTSTFNSIRVVNTNADGVGMQVNNTSQSANATNGIFVSAESGKAIAIAAFVFSPLVPSIPGTDYTYGLMGANYNPEGAAVLGSSVYDGAGGAAVPQPAGPIGVYGSTAHTTGIPGVFDQRAASGKIFSGRFSGIEVISMTTAGNITANAFSGNGSGLTNVTGSLASNPAACGTNNFVTDIAADGTLTCNQPSSSNLSDVNSLATKVYADAGDASLAAPQYVTLGVNATLTNERVLTGGQGITITDGGSGNAVTVHNKAEFAQTSIQAGDTVTTNAVFASTYTIPANTLQAGSVIESWATGLYTNGSTSNQFAVTTRVGGTNMPALPEGIFVGASQSNLPWQFQGRIICISVVGTTATLEAQATFSMNVSNTPSGGQIVSTTKLLNSTSTFTVDPTVANVIGIVPDVFGFPLPGSFNNPGVDSATMRQFIVKILK